jgi:hypothetical protein
MLGMVKLLWDWLVSLTKSRRQLEVGNLLLRHQAHVAEQCGPAGVRLALSTLPGCCCCRRGHQAGDADPLASARVQSILALVPTENPVRRRSLPDF